MILNFELENINYLKIEYKKNDEMITKKLALKQKEESCFIAVMPLEKEFFEQTPFPISLSFICPDGVYNTNSVVTSIYQDQNNTVFEIKNPKTLDYNQNRKYYRVLAEFDCIYTIETDDGIESFNARTYDISKSGVSIITEKNLIPTKETSIIIYTPTRSLKAYLEFVRCESYDDLYKLSFTFLDLNENDTDLLTQICVDNQYML